MYMSRILWKEYDGSKSLKISEGNDFKRSLDGDNAFIMICMSIMSFQQLRAGKWPEDIHYYLSLIATISVF